MKPNNKVALMEALIFVTQETKNLGLPFDNKTTDPQKLVDLYMNQIVEHYKKPEMGGLKKAKDFYEKYKRKMYEEKEPEEKLGKPVKYVSSDALKKTYIYLSNISNQDKRIDPSDLETITTPKEVKGLENEVNGLMKNMCKRLEKTNKDEAEKVYKDYVNLMSGEEIA